MEELQSERLLERELLVVREVREVPALLHMRQVLLEIIQT
jgi:hypothetical protein